MYYTAMCNAMSMVPAAGHEKSDIAVAFGVAIFVNVDDFEIRQRSRFSLCCFLTCPRLASMRTPGGPFYTW